MIRQVIKATVPRILQLHSWIVQGHLSGTVIPRSTDTSFTIQTMANYETTEVAMCQYKKITSIKMNETEFM